MGNVYQVVERLCREVQKQARLYQESIRDVSELVDTTGVELFQGRSSGKNRSMVAIRKEKIQRAKTYWRVMEEEKMLGTFIRLVDYLFVEGGMKYILYCPRLSCICPSHRTSVVS